jgi:aminotransferase
MPHGAYYVMTDISSFGFDDDVAFARQLVAGGGVAAVPGSSFYSEPAAGRQRLRFHFARRRETLEAAAERLYRLRPPARAT